MWKWEAEVKLASMELTKADRAEQMPTCSDGKDNGPVYPYGLSLQLDNDSLEKLGLATMPEVGTTVTVQAKATVTGCSANQYERDGKTETRKSCSLQITDMAVGGEGKGDVASTLYDGDAAE